MQLNFRLIKQIHWPLFTHHLTGFEKGKPRINMNYLKKFDKFDFGDYEILASIVRKLNLFFYNPI